MSEANRIQNTQVSGNYARPQGARRGADPAAGPSFAETFSQVQGIQFSNHAQKRLQTRDIQLNDQDVNRLADAVDKVEKRGGKSSLVLVDDLAFIVNVRERLVVTAMDSKERGEGVFNQIDSVVFAAPAEQQESSAAPVEPDGE